MVKSDKKLNVTKRRENLIKFLSRTREGKYAVVEESSLPYARISKGMEDIECDQEIYFYGVA